MSIGTILSKQLENIILFSLSLLSTVIYAFYIRKKEKVSYNLLIQVGSSITVGSFLVILFESLGADISETSMIKIFFSSVTFFFLIHLFSTNKIAKIINRDYKLINIFKSKHSLAGNIQSIINTIDNHLKNKDDVKLIQCEGYLERAYNSITEYTDIDVDTKYSEILGVIDEAKLKICAFATDNVLLWEEPKTYLYLLRQIRAAERNLNFSNTFPVIDLMSMDPIFDDTALEKCNFSRLYIYKKEVYDSNLMLFTYIWNIHVAMGITPLFCDFDKMEAVFSKSEIKTELEKLNDKLQFRKGKGVFNILPDFTLIDDKMVVIKYTGLKGEAIILDSINDKDTIESAAVLYSTILKSIRGSFMTPINHIP